MPRKQRKKYYNPWGQGRYEFDKWLLNLAPAEGQNAYEAQNAYNEYARNSEIANAQNYAGEAGYQGGWQGNNEAEQQNAFQNMLSPAWQAERDNAQAAIEQAGQREAQGLNGPIGRPTAGVFKKDPHRPPDHLVDAALYITNCTLRFNTTFNFDHPVYEMGTKRTYVNGKKSYKGLPFKKSNVVSIINIDIFIEGRWNEIENRFEGYTRFIEITPVGTDILDFDIIKDDGIILYSQYFISSGYNFTTDESITEEFIKRYNSLPDDHIFSLYMLTFYTTRQLTTKENYELNKLFNNIKIKLKKAIKFYATDENISGPNVIIQSTFNLETTRRFEINTTTPKVKVGGKYLPDYNNATVYDKN